MRMKNKPDSDYNMSSFILPYGVFFSLLICGGCLVYFVFFSFLYFSHTHTYTSVFLFIFMILKKPKETTIN
jgi:hypothetical protein